MRDPGRRSVWLLAAALLLGAGGPGRLAAAQPPDLAGARVLLLFSYHPGFPSSAPVLRTLAQALGPRGVTLDPEYLDSKRYPGAASAQRFEELLAHKLERARPYDVVVACDDNALEFALSRRGLLFPGAPVVFLGVNNVERALALDADPTVTGVVEQVSIGATVALARRLMPQLRELVALVDDTPSGRADLAAWRALGDRERRLRLSHLSLGDLSWEEAVERVGQLRADQALLRLASYRDRTGEVRSAADALALLAQAAPVPTFSLRRHDVGLGAAGGVVVDFEAQAREAARLITALLSATPAARLPVVRESPNVPAVDVAVLERFGLDASLAPRGTVLVNPPPRRDLGPVALVLLLAVVALVGVIVVLLSQMLRRRRVEAITRESEARYRVMVEGSLQGVLIHRDGVPLFANRSYAELLGYASPAEVLALGHVDRIYAPHESERLRGYREARARGRTAPREYDVEVVREDGSTIIVHNVVNATTWNGALATQHHIMDVTERERSARLLRESEARYRTLVENAPEAVVVLDADARRFVDANAQALALFRMTREQLGSFDPITLSPPRQPCGRPSGELAAEMIARALAGEPVMFEWIHRTVGGVDVPTEVRLVRLPSSSRRLVRGSITDISDRLAARQALMEKSAQLEATLENTDQGISMVDAELRVVAFNRRFLDLLGFPADGFAAGDPLEKFIRFNAARGEYGAGDVDALVTERLERAKRFEAHRFTRTRPDGTVLEIRSRPRPDGGFVTTYTDVTETHRLSQQLAHQARHDALTGLVNRREFEELLAEALAGAREHGRTHAMCYLDLDQFKVVNDTCGHVAGDELLRQMGDTLRSRVRRSDVVARLGGDEFGVLLDDCSPAEARRVAALLREAVEELPFMWEDRSFRVGVSIGLVPVTRDSGTVTDVLAAADAACYTAKDQGRNRIHVYCDGDSELASRQGEMRWVMRLQQALDEDRLCLMCQPILPLAPARADGDAVGEHCEVLVRMLDEDGSMVSPAQFLPAAERYNLMGRLDRWVVRHAFDVLAASPARLEGLFACSINLSGQSLSDDEFLAFIDQEFTRTGVPPAKIVFEITETAAISNLARAARFMGALRGLGCRFALDDFGSGLCSFGYLKTLPVDFLKIDGMFVRDILDDPIDHAMVRAINEMGHVMGKRTIAEFVETPAVRERLARIGVDYVQGFGVGVPVPFTGRRAGALRRVS